MLTVANVDTLRTIAQTLGENGWPGVAGDLREIAGRAEAAAEATDHATLLPHILDISQAVARISICVALLLDYADADPTAALKATLNAALLDPARAPPHPVEPEQPPC